MFLKRLYPLLGAVALVVATSAAAYGTDGGGRAVDSTAISVRVMNQNWLDMRVYAVTETGAYQRLGTVTSFTDAEFALPRWLDAGTNDIRLLAVPIGSRQWHISEPILVSPGDEIEWRIENNLMMSSVSVLHP